MFDFQPYSLFIKVFAPSSEIKKCVKELGARDVEILPNMKTISDKPAVDLDDAEKLRSAIGDRKIWIAVSTHKGEEEIILEAHKKLKEIHKDIVTVVAPRHPSRADKIGLLCSSMGLSYSMYSNNSDHKDRIKSDIYILNEIGKLSEFYEVIDTVLVCGSLLDGIGGHNILEPMHFMCNVATGPYMDNFKDIYENVKKHCKIVSSAEEIIVFVDDSIKTFTRDPHMMRNINFLPPWVKAIKQIAMRIK
jgi:3-deoxy-D-manno-octulosonic-acid transferase